MNKLRITLLLLACCCIGICSMAKKVSVSSPDGIITVSVGVKDNKPYYSVSRGETMIVTPSHLGFQLDGGLLGDNVRMTGKKTASKDETWQQVWGEEDTVRNHYNELTVTFEERVGKKEQMNVQFRVFNDGIGFRYILPHILHVFIRAASVFCTDLAEISTII